MPTIGQFMHQSDIFFPLSTETDNKCEKFWHQLFKYPGHNLREGLRCLNYTSNITSSQALGNSSSLQHIHFDTISLDITEIDEVKEHIRLYDNACGI